MKVDNDIHSNNNNTIQVNVVVSMLTGEFTGIKVLATVTVAVATVLAALAVYLCLNRNRQSRNDKGDHKILHYKPTLAVKKKVRLF